MAGAWIKLRHDLCDAPEIRRLARACGVTRDDVLGKLFRLWSWFDRHSIDGMVADETSDLVDELVGLSGFAAALVSVGWLAEDKFGIVIPNWDRHNSETAKQRTLSAERQQKHREKRQCNGGVTQPALRVVTQAALPEKRREEIHHPPRGDFDEQTWQQLRKAWNAGPGKRWGLVSPPAKAVDRLADGDWVRMYPEAIARLRSCRFFESPVTLNQFCGPEFVMHVLGGSYDAPKRGKTAKDFADTPPPPRAFTGDVAEAFERPRRKLQEQK